jgi:Dyp-type peroxidase family
MAELEYDDIQGLVFSGYGKRMAAASYHLLRVDDRTKAKGWLRALAGRVTKGHPKGAQPPTRTLPYRLNVAFSASGLLKFGLDERLDLVTFEQAFREGMTSERRSRILGDNKQNAPENWAWGYDKSVVDVLLLIYGQSPGDLNTQEGAEVAEYRAGGLLPVVPPVSAVELLGGSGSPDPFSREQFGFADGISQPVILEHAGPGLHAVAAGEFVLGYENQYGYQTEVPHRNAARGPAGAVLSAAVRKSSEPAFGQNGTYLAVRQLRQDVAGFWTFLRDRAGGDDVRATLLAAKMIGRWPSGAVVKDGQIADPGGPPENDFTYADTDPDGYGVPIGAHIRRSNPRGTGLAATTADSLDVASKHRLMRRGRSYGPRIAGRYTDDGVERGLFFVALNANIERQFEFVQHTWMNNPMFGALYDEVDSVIGDPAQTDGQRVELSTPWHPVRRRVHDIQRFVTVRGGGYFFLPGIRALEILSS